MRSFGEGGGGARCCSWIFWCASAPRRSTRCAHLAEFGLVAPQGRAHVAGLALALDEAASSLPAAVHELGTLLLERIAALDAKIAGLDREIHLHARRDADAARLMTIPGIGPICAMAIQAFAPPLESFRCGRDFSAWLGLVPHSTGGKPRLGRISKMGQRDLRRLLVCGAMAQLRWAIRRGGSRTPGWPGQWSWRWRWPTGWRASPGR